VRRGEVRRTEDAPRRPWLFVPIVVRNRSDDESKTTAMVVIPNHLGWTSDHTAPLTKLSRGPVQRRRD
jgi:hypothetical protein